MKKYKLHFFLRMPIALILLLCALDIFSQTKIQFDLSNNITSEVRIVKPNVNFKVILENHSSSWTYTYELEQSRELEPPLRLQANEASRTFSSGGYNIYDGSLIKGEQLTIKVHGKDATGLIAKDWLYIIKTSSRGTWVTTFGFNHVSYLFKNNSYYTIQDTNYIITKIKHGNKNQDWLDIKPSITFRWFANKTKEKNWLYNFDWSFMAGVGTNFQESNVLLGLGVSYNQNISLDLGLTTNKVRVLADRYNEGQKVSGFLTESELHKSITVINPFINVAFRLDKNSFSN